MVFGEDLSALYHAFHDRLSDDGKEQKLIKCQICCNEEVPSHSTNSSICEMCFDDDFWLKMEEVKKSKTDMLWVIKATEEGLLGGCYFSKGQYLGMKPSRTTSEDALGKAYFYQTKTEADAWIESLALDTRGGKPPIFATVQVMLTEVG